MATKRAELNLGFSADVNSGSLTKLGSGRATQTPAACENAGPNQGRFQPGQSGNPAGRPGAAAWTPARFGEACRPSST